ncbi:hypothetical protein [Paenibacillus hamazuiensis]|uniref:hypothetical protein n=1 Tax=Paenibacillus hamazuiensis TaxID=2936508 RepID=UPI00200DB604|nr:hypothetical protein [Paenibacillus hamazuiensis]
MQRDTNGRAKVAAPSAADDIARKDTVDSAMSAHTNASDPHPQYATDNDMNVHKTAAVLDHPDGSVTTAKLANGAVTATKVASDVATKAQLDGAVGTLSSLLTTAKNNVVAAINELFQYASDGKKAIAAAITGKGVPASGSDTFAQLSSKISSIQLATGNAGTGDVLAGKTFSNATTTGATGTMPNNGALNYTPSGNAQSIPAGYTSGGTVSAVSVPVANVLVGTTIAGQTGTMPNRGATVITPSSSNQTISAGYHNGSGYVAGVNVPAASVLYGTTIAGVAGTMPNQGSVVITPSTSNQGIPAGYHNGSGYVAGVSVPTDRVLTGTWIAGVQGTMPNNGAPTWNPTTYDQWLGAGYYSGGRIIGEPNLQPGNILKNVSMFGVAGTLDTMERRGSTALITGVTSVSFNVTGLPYQPKAIYIVVYNEYGVSVASLRWLYYQLSPSGQSSNSSYTISPTSDGFTFQETKPSGVNIRQSYSWTTLG